MVSSQLFISYKQNHSILLWRPTFNLRSGVLASATWPRERHDMRSMYIVALMTSGRRSWPQKRLVLKLSILQELRPRVLELAHEGHQGIVKTKCRLRSSSSKSMVAQDGCWCREAVQEFHGCQAVSEYAPLEPMARAFSPSGPWEDCAADILGPLPSGESLLVVVDYFSRYFVKTMTQTLAKSWTGKEER